MSDTVLDARGLTCPLPILRARKVLQGVPEGGVVAVLATDPASVSDFQTFCRQTGHVLMEYRQEPEGVFFYRIRKGG